MHKKRIKLSILGILLIIISLIIPFIKKQVEYKKDEEIHQKIVYYKEVTTKDEPKENKKSNIINNYIAILEIPDLNIYNGLYNKYSKYNDVKYNVAILPNSSMPDIENSNLILASHNGTSNVSYFRNLSNINESTLIYLYYNGYKYIYKYHHSYEVIKNGVVEIKRDRFVNTITLITCKENDDTKQVVYIGYLISKESY